MEIADNIKIIDLALYINKKILVISDTHIGYEEALNKQGILVPRLHFKDLVKRLEKILSRTKPKVIVINGDIKHEFSKISEQEWRETLKVVELLAKNCDELFLIKGNHDTVLGPIAKKRNIKLMDKYITEDIIILHGDMVPKVIKEKTIIIGHEHPAVSIQTKTRKEKYKCFLKGSFKGKTLIVMPSFNLLTEGTDIKEERTLSPFLKQDLSDFEVYIVGDKLYNFGKLKNL